MKKKFFENINMDSREEMAQFLAGHFRYWTGNSWNRLSSYANNMKVDEFGLGNEIVEKLYELLETGECDEFWFPIHCLIEDFNRDHDYHWQAGRNGRSGGYLVLYHGGRRETGYKSFCTVCGQKNWEPASEGNCRCGRCGGDTRRNFTKPHMEIYTTMEGTDECMDEEDFLEWDTEQFRERVKLVQDFDHLCDDIAGTAVAIAEEYDLVEEEYEVVETRTRTVLKPKAAAVEKSAAPQETAM